MAGPKPTGKQAPGNRLAELLAVEMPAGRHSYDVALEFAERDHSRARHLLAYVRKAFPDLRRQMQAEPPRKFTLTMTPEIAAVLAQEVLDHSGLRMIVDECFAQGVLQKELAPLIGVSYQYFDHMLCGHRPVAQKLLPALRSAFKNLDKSTI